MSGPDCRQTKETWTYPVGMKLKKSLVAVVALLSNAAGLYAQIPTKCLEIESILADACISATDCPTSTEGMNEMVRFITGPAPIQSSDLQFEFFSSTFQGIAQNATTAALTATLNASVQGCGLLLEPPGGVIPAGSRVIFVGSTAMCVEANSFTALNDTLYIIFQNAGNSQGHFKNNDLSGQPITTTPDAPLMRWLRINVNGTGCGDTATYDANQLLNIYGSYGGLSAENDGAVVEFSWPGTPLATYVNHGCQAPFEPTIATVVSGGGNIPCGSTAALMGSVSGSHVAVLWQGGGGSFSDPGSTTTSYAPGGGDNGAVDLSFCAITACGDTLCSQVTVITGAMPNVSLTGDTTLCGPSDTILLTASGADTYVWSTGATGPELLEEITGPTEYWVAGTNACGSDTAYITPRWMHTTIHYTSISCHGAADGVLTAEGTGGVWPYAVLWSNGSTDTMITGLAAGAYTYTITDADGCTQTGEATLTEPAPVVADFSWDPVVPQAGAEVQFTDLSSGATAWAWMFGDSAGSVSTEASPVFIFPTADCYSVVLEASNGAGCTHAITKELCPKGPGSDSLLVPNVFSPNGDGVNDVFRITGGNLARLEVQVFNRWGQLVALLERVNQVWDGRSPAGEVLSEGTYFYILRAAGKDGREHDLSGTVTLVR